MKILFSSGIECKDEIYSSAQLSSVKSEIDLPEEQIQICVTSSTTTTTPLVSPQIPDTTTPAVAVEIVDIQHRPLTVTSKLFSPILEAPSVPRPQTATSKIFAPRTEEMSKGFLMFSEEEPGLTVLKDEPDDLTHLAPTAGDVCIPLEDNPLISDMLNDFLGENYCPLFTDDPLSLDSECSKNSNPFIPYQDEYDDNTTSPHLLSPTLSSKSHDCTIASLNSPGNSLGEDEHMNTFISLQMDEDEPDLSAKAPYIPMNGRDDFPLLSNDLMWNAIPSQNKIKTANKIVANTSSLANLLCTSVTKSTIKQSNDHGGGGTRIRTNQRNERTNKRMCNSMYDPATKRSKNDPKEKLSSELLQQLISNNNQRQRTKNKTWLLDTGGKTQAACVSQPSDSVLMNLLEPSPADIESQLNNIPLTVLEKSRSKPPDEPRKYMRKNSTSLLDPSGIPSLFDLTQQDYEVNAPVNSFLLQGQDLITALDINEGLMLT